MIRRICRQGNYGRTEGWCLSVGPLRLAIGRVHGYYAGRRCQMRRMTDEQGFKIEAQAFRTIIAIGIAI